MHDHKDKPNFVIASEARQSKIWFIRKRLLRPPHQVQGPRNDKVRNPCKTRVRFAPSPTGSLHIGGLRTALYNFLFTRHSGGKFLLRIEDTDRKRLVPESEKEIIELLDFFGLKPDEKLIRQSDRLSVYQQAAQELVASGKAYPCFCSSERLEKLRTEQEKNKHQPRYDGLCRSLPPEEAAERAKKESHVIRFAVPDGKTKTNDIIHGASVIENATLDDFVLLKSDGFPTYHLASVTDDHETKITHIIRGEEWLPSLAKHILLYRAFGWRAPQFAHLPLLLSSSKKKLSKREADVSVVSYLEQGYLKEALLNFVVLLGWNPSAEREKYTVADLIDAFDLSAVNKNGAVVNFEKLRWLNREYLKNLSFGEFQEKARPYLKQSFGCLKETFFEPDEEKILTVLRERIHVFSDIAPSEINFLSKPDFSDPKLLIWKKSNIEETKSCLSFVTDFLKNQPAAFFSDANNIERALLELKEKKGWDAGSVFWPVRYALSGQEASPSPFVLIWILGKEESINRLHYAQNVLAKS